MSTYIRLRNLMVKMKDWYNAADPIECEELISALEDHMQNLATCFKCADPQNAQHCKEIDAIKAELND